MYLLGKTDPLQPQRLLVDDLFQECCKPLRYPSLGPVQRPHNDSKPGVAHLMANFDVLIPVSGKQTAMMRMFSRYSSLVHTAYPPRGKKHEMRRSKSETTKTSVNYEDVLSRKWIGP